MNDHILTFRSRFSDYHQLPWIMPKSRYCWRSLCKRHYTNKMQWQPKFLHTWMNQVERRTLPLHVTHKQMRLMVKQRGSPLLWTKDWSQCFCCGPQTGGRPFLSHKTNCPKFGLIAAGREGMEGFSFTWMNYGTGGSVTVFFFYFTFKWSIKKSTRQNIFSACFPNPRVAVKPQQLKMFSLAPSLMHP